jgi:hypothetical protein
MRRVVEILATLPGPSGSPEIVDGDGIDTALREPQRELLVERVEAADVGQDDDPDAARLGRSGPKRRQRVAVGRGEDGPLPVEGAAGDRRDRWAAVVVMAHGHSSLERIDGKAG